MGTHPAPLPYPLEIDYNTQIFYPVRLLENLKSTYEKTTNIPKYLGKISTRKETKFTKQKKEHSRKPT